jgi:hypothetical protein
MALEQAPSALAHFLFSRGRECTFRVTGSDEVTVYAGNCGMGSSHGATMAAVRKMSKADARAEYRGLVADGWTRS